jgi:hypothetical protein
MSTKTTAQLVRQITLSLLLLSAITQGITILSFLFGTHVLMPIHKLNGYILFILVLTHIIVFRKNLKFYLFPNKKPVGKKV